MQNKKSVRKVDLYQRIIQS